MKRIVAAGLMVLLAMGCSPKVRFESTKPIKIDVSMRVDVYQHVAKEANAVADFITGEPAPKAEAKPQSILRGLSFVSTAYAQEAVLEHFSAPAKGAMQASKSRRQTLTEWEAKGAIGETSKGLVVLKSNSASASDMDEANNLISAENQDRKAIYEDSAARNNTSIDAIGAVYAKSFQQSAPSGTPIETEQGWQVKK